MLYFNNESSVFEEEKIIKEMNKKKNFMQQKADYFMNPMQKIAPQLQKLYYDLNKKEKSNNIYLWTGFFLLKANSKLENGK